MINFLKFKLKEIREKSGYFRINRDNLFRQFYFIFEKNAKRWRTVDDRDEWKSMTQLQATPYPATLYIYICTYACICYRTFTPLVV